MNILFLTMSPQILKLEDRNIYNDLARKFLAEGHSLYVIVPFERRTGKKTAYYQEAGVNVLGVRTLNVTMTNVIEKGLGQVLLENQFKTAFKKFLSDVKFDLILYSTPPITFTNVIKYVKKLNPQAKSYLMLKDIFPQNAVDIGMLSTSGVKGLLYRSFRRKEKQLYKASDWIGCMSPANAKYIIKHNPEVNPQVVEVCPNSYEIVEKTTNADRNTILQKYGLPTDKPVFIYGGNLGKPQGIPFLIECLRANKNREDCAFVIVGNGTEYEKIEAWVKAEAPKSVNLYQRLPKSDYDKLAEACDVGLIFLDYRFTIPNYPSRLLPYLMSKKPIIACTDPNCDTGTIAEANGYGFWCPSNSAQAFTNAVDKMLASDIKQMGEKGYQFFLENYTVQNTYDTIMKHFQI